MVNIYRLDKPELLIGRKSPCDIVLRDNMELSAVHLKFFVKGTTGYVTVSGKNGAYINDKFICGNETVSLSFADEIKLPGITVLWLYKEIVLGTNSNNVAACLNELTHEAVKNRADKFIQGYRNEEFHIAPRNITGFNEEVMELDNPPEKKVMENQSMFSTIGPAFSMALPMAAGFLVTAFAQKNTGNSSSAFMYTGLITAVASAFIGVFWGFVNVKNRKKTIISEEKKRRSLYLSYVKNAEDTLREKYLKKVGSLNLLYKTAREIMIGGGDKYLIWNRTEDDNDFLYVRLGLGSIPFEIKINVPKDKFSVNTDELKQLPKLLKNKYQALSDVPVGIDLRKNKITGIVSDSILSVTELLTIIISQLAVNNDPAAVRLACIFESPDDYIRIYGAIRLLPHFFTGNMLLYTVNSSSCREINKNITDVIKENESQKLQFVVITDDYSLIDDEIKNYPYAYFIIASRSYEKLPGRLGAIVQRDANFSGIIDFLSDTKKREEVYFDNISFKELSDFSRDLMALYRPAITAKANLPDIVPFYLLYEKKPDADYILSLWENNRTFDAIKAFIGIDDEGVTLLDLHEKSMGPHGLIAGTTGSGKSEILQTIILSLAINYSPLDISFFIIDYKGSGMASYFESLPHLAGSISNLSGRMITRAMASIRSENNRRQKIFLQAGVNNISEYQRLFYENTAHTPLPHIFIIIDEFAELKREEPEFMGELVSVARVGRSLGVHLILATQKPSGTVDDNIWSNSRFKICLRVSDRIDSNEMLKKPDASYLTNPGRAYLQVGNDEIYKLFQGAYTMDKSRDFTAKRYVYVMDNAGRLIKNEDKIAESGEPQLYETVKNIKDAYSKSKINFKNRLWLKPLPKRLIYENDREDEHDICIGLFDDPMRQRQGFLRINILNNGNYFILGTLQAGKSTLLSTVSYALIQNENPENLNLYFIDFSNGTLSPFKKSHLTGGYINSENEEALIKLFIMAKEIIDERKSILKGENFKQHVLRSFDMSAVYIIIDGFGALREITECKYDRELLYILKNGEASGVYVILSALNVSSMELAPRFLETFKQGIVLKQADKYAYREALRIPGDVGVIPEDIPGRGIVRINDETVEFQSFLPVDKDDFERMNFISGEVKRISDEYVLKHKDFKGVKRIPEIPAKCVLSVFEKEQFLQFDDKIPVGYEALSGKIFYMPVNIPVFVSGRIGSGKKNFVSVAAYMAEKFKKEVNITVYDEALSFDKLAEIKKTAGINPYVIHFGGALDRQNFADYSYIPYSSQTKIKNAGHALVRKINEELFYGDVVIPLMDNDDNF